MEATFHQKKVGGHEESSAFAAAAEAEASEPMHKERGLTASDLVLMAPWS